MFPRVIYSSMLLVVEVLVACCTSLASGTAALCTHCLALASLVAPVLLYSLSGSAPRTKGGPACCQKQQRWLPHGLARCVSQREVGGGARGRGRASVLWLQGVPPAHTHHPHHPPVSAVWGAAVPGSPLCQPPERDVAQQHGLGARDKGRARARGRRRVKTRRKAGNGLRRCLHDREPRSARWRGHGGIVRGHCAVGIRVAAVPRKVVASSERACQVADPGSRKGARGRGGGGVVHQPVRPAASPSRALPPDTRACDQTPRSRWSPASLGQRRARAA